MERISVEELAKHFKVTIARARAAQDDIGFMYRERSDAALVCRNCGDPAMTKSDLAAEIIKILVREIYFDEREESYYYGDAVPQIMDLFAGQPQTSQEPVAWKYDWRMKMFAYGDEDGWVTTVSFKQPKEDHRNGYRNVTPLYIASDTALPNKDQEKING